MAATLERRGPWPSLDELKQAAAGKARATLPQFRRNSWWNADAAMQVEMDRTCMGFGCGLDIVGSDPRGPACDGAGTMPRIPAGD